MERSDDKNPFDPDTYDRPALSIKTTLELRAFCAEFFDRHIRTSVKTDEEDIAAFLALITYSQSFFARARAVIPELQAPDVESSHPNENVQVFLYAIRDMRGPPGMKWEFLPEESAWTKLAKEGMDNLARNIANNGTRHNKQASDASARGPSSKHTLGIMPEKAENIPSETPLHPPKSVKSKPESLPKKLDLPAIPTFVPGNAMGSDELVWSPTSGTRQRRTDELYQSTKASPANPIQFGQVIPPNPTSAYSIKAQYLFHGSRDLSDTPTKGHSDSIRITPPPQFKSTQSPLNPSAASSGRSKGNSTNPRRMRRNNLEETPFPDSTNRMMEMATLGHDPTSKYPSSSRYDTTAYPVNDLSRTNTPSQSKGPQYPSSQARGVYGADPFSAPPSVPGYGTLNQSSQGMYGGPPSPFQGQLGPLQSRPQAASFHSFPDQVPYVPNPDLWATHAQRPRHGALPNQMIQPIPQMTARTQLPPSMAQAPTSEALSVPPPGSMDPLDYWTLLTQREKDINARLQNANRPMTTHEHRYISLLREARITAAATQLPARGGMSKGKWLAELGRTLRSIWKTGPRGAGFPPVVVARKMDFEKAIEREIGLTSQERQHADFGSALDRAYGA